MFSVRHSKVRESLPPGTNDHRAAQQNSHHAAEATLSESSSLFLIHQLRQQDSTRPRRSLRAMLSWWRRRD
ncbi:MAG: hypothetical protein KDN20_20135 [Verrucomicrobiae bacterium]|nr:hypothetical protein [Verrucomicrobiae bacterium]